MTFKETMAKLFDSSEGAYYKWKKENRPIINLLEKYFTKEELEEFLDSGRIARLENLPNINTILAEIENRIKKVLSNLGNFGYDDLTIFVSNFKWELAHEFLNNKDVEMSSKDFVIKSKELDNQVFFTQTKILQMIENSEKIDTKTKIAYISSLGSLSYAQFKIWIQYGV